MAKTKKVKLPKSVGGVKIPKDLRRKGEKLIGGAIDTANSPKGREMLAMGLAAVATAAAAKAAKAHGEHPKQPRPPEPLHPPEPPVPGRPGIEANVDQVVEAVSAAANAFLQRLRERKG
jgi:hypothetical protein